MEVCIQDYTQNLSGVLNRFPVKSFKGSSMALLFFALEFFYSGLIRSLVFRPRESSLTISFKLQFAVTLFHRATLNFLLVCFLSLFNSSIHQTSFTLLVSFGQDQNQLLHLRYFLKWNHYDSYQYPRNTWYTMQSLECHGKPTYWGRSAGIPQAHCSRLAIVWQPFIPLVQVTSTLRLDSPSLQSVLKLSLVIPLQSPSHSFPTWTCTGTVGLYIHIKKLF